MSGSPPRSLAARFWEKVDKNGPVPEHRPELGPCWAWIAYRNAHGYGEIGSGGRRGPILRAHRVSYELANGPIQAGLDVCHHCDNPACVNPGHLFLGTHDDNMKDMKLKGRSGPKNHPERMPRGDRHGLRLHPERIARGEDTGPAKLTNEQVREIRRLAPSLSRRDLARRFGVDRRTITFIAQGKTWRHLLPGAPS